MHLLASFKNGSMRALPQILPAGLHEAAARRGAPRQASATRPAPDGAPVSAIPRQFSGGGYPGPQRQGTGVSQTNEQWAVTQQDKSQFDQIFATVDPQNRGFITGEQAVGFFSNSRLPEEALAQIWDLADINSKGQLNRDEFAVAMYLIRQQRSKTSGREVLPQSLPPNLIPPSMRRQPIAPQQPTAPVFDNAASMPKSASEDLFGLDAFTTSPPIQPKTTGDSSVYSTPPRSAVSPPPQQQQLPQQPTQQASHFKPFIPSSSFGQAIMTPQGTGTSSSASPAQPRSVPSTQKQPSAMDDLLGDNDPEVSKKLTNETSELANLSSQVSTLTGQMQEIKSKRGSTEQDVSQAQAQKRDFENRLRQLRSAYEQEVKEVRALEERLAASRNETKKLQSDMAMIQGAHDDLQTQHRQIAEALGSDQNENANLKERIRQITAETNELKPQLEKLRSDARHQKGLVAINKKQLATQEAEREKMKGDMDGASAEHEEATRDLEQSKRDIETASQVRSPAAAVASPAPSTASMNPFFRSTNAPTTERGTVTSPFTPINLASPVNHNAFDNFFGPTVPAADGPLPTSFRSQSQDITREIPSGQAMSLPSSDGPGEPTPSASPPHSNFSDSPPSASEPPAPPQSRQITSSFLPLRAHERSGSDSDSVKVMPPASRMGDRSGSGFDTPTLAREPSIPESPKQHFQEMAAKAPRNEASDLGSSFQHVPLASAQEAAVPDTLAQSSGMPSATRDVPGAFPGDESPPEEPQSSIQQSASPYSSSVLDPRVDSVPRNLAIPATNESSANALNSDDPFARATTPTSSKDDFDSAFAGFGDSKGKVPEQLSGTIPSAVVGDSVPPQSHREFPPIQEFGADESESDEDRGFDDHFTGPLTNRVKELQQNESSRGQSPIVGSPGGFAALRPPFNTMESNQSQLPTPGAQASPPSYDQTVESGPRGSGDRKESNQFPAEYSGLLPSRDDPTSPTTSPPPSFPAPSSNVASSAGIDRSLNFFGNDTPEHAAGHAAASSTFSQEHSPMSPGASTAAPYAFTHSSSQPQAAPTYPAAASAQHPVDSFDDEFGDLSEAKEAPNVADDDLTLSRPNDFDDFNPTFDSPQTSHTQAPSTSNTFPHPGHSDSFADFDASGSAGGPALARGPQQTPSHDWDAIFAGLDTPQNNGVHSDSPSRGLDFTPSKPPGQNGTAGQVGNFGMPGPAGTAGIGVGPALPTREGAQVSKVDSANDDPILKRLTGMGFARDPSLAALEKFDYNIDKVRF